MSVSLPKGETNKGKAKWSDVYGNDKALKDATETLEGKFPVSAANLAAAAKPLTRYTPKVIATEQSRENTSFGKLTTADEIAEVVLPENGLILVGFSAAVKSSVSSAGSAAIFIGSNQLKADLGGTAPATQAATTSGTGFRHVSSTMFGLTGGESAAWTGDITTGQALATVGTGAALLGGMCAIFAAAGTYVISVQFKATSGSVTAKERKLWVCVLGA